MSDILFKPVVSESLFKTNLHNVISGIERVGGSPAALLSVSVAEFVLSMAQNGVTIKLETPKTTRELS